VKVSFSTINPKDFESKSLGGRRAEPNFLENVLKAKQKKESKEKRKENAQLAAEQRAIREEHLKNRLLEIKCANRSCKSVIEYVYDDRKSGHFALMEARWVAFGGYIKGYLCPTCANIQKIRLNKARK
jgi:hypothetical protein